MKYWFSKHEEAIILIIKNVSVLKGQSRIMVILTMLEVLNSHEPLKNPNFLCFFSHREKAAEEELILADNFFLLILLRITHP